MSPRLALLPLLLAAVLAAASAPRRAGAEIVDRVAAVVNKDVILLSEVEENVALVRQPDDGPEELAELRDFVLEQLIGRKLIEQAMDRAGIAVDEAEVQRYIAQIQKQYGLTEEQLRAEVERSGATWEEFLRDKREELRYEKFLQAEIRQRIQIAEEDLRSAYNQKRAHAPKDPQVHLFMILLRDRPEGRAATLERARELRRQIREGRSFAEVAKEESALPNAAQGGDSGFVRIADLNPAFREAVAEVPPEGGVTEPIETSQGVWLLAVKERRETSLPSYEEMRNALWRELVQQREEKAIAEWVDRRRRESHVEVLLPASRPAEGSPSAPGASESDPEGAEPAPADPPAQEEASPPPVEGEPSPAEEAFPPPVEGEPSPAEEEAFPPPAEGEPSPGQGEPAPSPAP